ncbi:MAG: PQQ-binding-like beta-propeller repeat protein [Acidobacteria bacterium]|nr:PQQ-binding-like beta-propeller repeat protein [Acidobacteriota bacterium]
MFPLPWELVLKREGRQGLVGAVSSCLAGRAVEIADGKYSGDALSFTCTSPDGKKSLSFHGAIRGDEITFTWEIVKGENLYPTDGLFGPKAPKRFTAMRASRGSSTVVRMAQEARSHPDIGFERILQSEREPENWLTYSGSLSGHRFTPLAQITPANVKNLEMAWVWQVQSPLPFIATSLVLDDVLYTVQPPNTVVALNAATGRIIWTYVHEPIPTARASGGGGRPNRGLAILGNKLFLGTLDAHLLAIDAYSGKLIWNTTVANAADPACQGRMCYVITHAPLIAKDKVIVGVGGGEGPTRGFIAAFDVSSGREVWRFHTVPGPGEPGNDTWAGESWKTGGAGVWNTGTYDAELGLTYWGIGNPYPPWKGETRSGDNLYSNSVVALDADTGKLHWFYQFTPHDTMDWDAAQIPVLADLAWQGRRRKLMLFANRNGLFYVLDRVNGQFLYGKPFAEVNWMDGIDEKGRPRTLIEKLKSSKAVVMPGLGATNWYPPSYSARTGLLYVPVWERGSVDGLNPQRGPAYGAIRALDPSTGERKWEFRKENVIFTTGALTTASDLLFAGVMGDDYAGDEAARLANGYFYALNARTGEPLWQMALPGEVRSGVISFAAAGRQHLLVAAGNTVFAFALRK